MKKAENRSNHEYFIIILIFLAPGIDTRKILWYNIAEGNNNMEEG